MDLDVTTFFQERELEKVYIAQTIDDTIAVQFVVGYYDENFRN
ncbi:hypothetical protein FACS1894126_5820 [Alphaproteobacteria bacterium]|nr:hypothetical protein FACS1894126_5820 [Alphaproteobacteria bacterium]